MRGSQFATGSSSQHEREPLLMPISAEPEERGSPAPFPVEVRILGGQIETSQCWGAVEGGAMRVEGSESHREVFSPASVGREPDGAVEGEPPWRVMHLERDVPERHNATTTIHAQKHRPAHAGRSPGCKKPGDLSATGLRNSAAEPGANTRPARRTRHPRTGASRSPSSPAFRSRWARSSSHGRWPAWSRRSCTGRSSCHLPRPSE